MKSVIFPLLIFLAACFVGVSTSDAQKLDSTKEYKDLQENQDVAMELVGITADGKVKVYRLYDHTWGVLCFITVGQLHGKTVTSQCFDNYHGRFTE